MNLGLSPLFSIPAQTRATSSLSSASVTFLRCGPVGDLLERLAADEVMVELDEGP